MKELWKKLLARLTRRRATVLGRLIWWMQIWGFVFFAALQTSMWFRSYPPRSVLDSTWTFLSLLGVQVIIVAAYWICVRSIRRRAGDLGWKMCNRCGYDLRPTPEPGPCPECGNEFTFRGLEDYWTRTWNR